MTRSKESEETFKLIAPGSLFQGRNSSHDLVVGYRQPNGTGIWLKGGWGWRLTRPWSGNSWPWRTMPESERDFVVIGHHPSLEALSDDSIKALCEASHVAPIKVGDTIDWSDTPDNAMVRDSNGDIALRRGNCGQWRCIERAGGRAWGHYISFRWDDSKYTVCRKADAVEVVALDVPLGCTSDEQLEAFAKASAPVAKMFGDMTAKKAAAVGDRIAWGEVPHWTLVHIEGDQYAIRFDGRGRSTHADGTYWKSKHEYIDKWEGLHTTCTVVAFTEYGASSGEVDRLIAAHEAQRTADTKPKVGDTIPWDKVPDNAMVKADGCIALRRGTRGQWYRNKYSTGWSTSSYIAFDWTNKSGARRDDNDAVIVALDVPVGTENTITELRAVAGDQ